MAAESGFDGRVEAVRRFNRFYTRRIGVLGEGLSRSPFTLAEARVLYELAHRDPATAAPLADELGLDPGYLSRILRRFRERGLLDRAPSGTDGRRSLLRLTAAGREAFAALDAGTRGEVGELLGGLPGDAQLRLVEAMGAVEELLGGAPGRGRTYVLRPPRAGELGWVVWLHGVLYAREYGWDERFEALVAEIVAGFGRGHDPARERCWIAEVEGRAVGSVFLVRQSDEVAKLRLLLVDPAARGLGIGRRLVDACVGFAREAGYRVVTLWTNDVLRAARRIYEDAGFRLVHEEPHHSFGHDLVGQTWELEL
ncbi:MAG TPA: bifunctional helix-turn-helix transcriptional regulator/GNAT family N-acetyltransferase [Longimicrobiaceae bacterium]|nr:bifunctional helix-turn-helix transcriptional regulator/GNAT family N-acetyltransferase [Longimicrobiaceae bacterium]